MPKFIVFSKHPCKWCDKAAALLTLRDKEFVKIDAEDSTIGRLIALSMDFKTLPQVFFGTKHIGGFEDLKKYLENA